KAESYFENAYEIAVDLQDSLKMGIYSLNLASVLNESGQIEKAVPFLETAFTYLENNKSLKEKVWIAKADHLILRERYLEAENILRDIFPNLQTPDRAEDLIMVYFVLAKIHERKSEWE